jgi:voltage-gated potassium channel
MSCGVQRSPRRRIHELLEVSRPGDRASKAIDVALMVLIVVSVGANVLESMPRLQASHQSLFDGLEMCCVAVFTLEYLLRVVCAVESSDSRFRSPLLGRLRFVLTPLALADLLAIAPFYLSAWIEVDLRLLRVLRLVRIFKLAHYFSALSILLDVIRTERHAFGAAYFVVILGLMMASSGVYLFEHQAQPEAFGSIPSAIWWAVATLTTVGYGDVTPITTGGKVFSTVVMIIGVGMVAVPTGILATGFAFELRRRRDAYDAELRAALKDGTVDAEERQHLEEVRRALDLDEADAADLEAATRSFPSPYYDGEARLTTCPHCGELLDGSEAKPMSPTAMSPTDPSF